ncbi:MAG: hypothetical protein LBM19_00200, partial [Holosporales bacterium]|nr:hypothetical protein [Holosporales bacterium]
IEECIRELGIDPNNFWVYDPRVGFQFLQFLANELGVRIRAYNARTEIRGIPVILGDRSLAVREIRPVGGEGQPLEEDFPVKEVVIDGNEVGGHWTVLVDPSTREGQTLALAILRQEHRSLGEAAVYLKERSIIDPEEVQRLLSEVDATVAREEQSVRNIEKAKIESFVEYVGIARVPGDVRAAYVALPQNLQQEDEVIMAFTTAIDRLEVGLSEVAAAGIEAPLALEEVDRLRDENQRLQQQLAERDARIAELERQLEDARGSMVSAPAAPVPVQPAEAGIPGEITGQASGEEAPVAPPPPPMDGAPPPSDQPAIKPGAVKQPGDQDNRPSAESIGITPGSLVAVNLKKTTPVASKKVEPTHLDLIKQGGFALRKVPPEEIKTKETRARAEAIANEKTQRELQRIERRIKAIQGILDSSKKSKGILRKTSEEGDKPLAERMKDIARNIPHRPSKFQTYVSGMGLTPPQRQGLEEQVRGLKREAERLRKQLPMLEQNDPRTLSIGEILMRVADIGKAVRSSDDEDEDADGDTESSEEEW